MISLVVQMFDGLDAIALGRFEPDGTQQLSVNQWTVEDPLLLWDIRSEVRGYSHNDFWDIPADVFSTLIRRFTGACDQALLQTERWKRPDLGDSLEIRKADGTTLRDVGLVATRYNAQPDPSGQKTFVHTSIDLRFADGTEIRVPSETEVMWSSKPFIVRHLNSIAFQGGGWVDKSSWKWADHLFSHGH